MYQDAYLDVTQQNQDHFDTFNSLAPNTPNDREEVVKVSPATIHCFEKGPRSLRPANENFVNYHDLPTGDYQTLTAVPASANVAAWQDPENDPTYFDLSEPQEEAKEEMKLGFDPPLTHYAELRDGLPIGYVWLPPSSPEPMPREATPDHEMAAFITPKRSASTMANGKNKRNKVVKFVTPEAEKKRQKRQKRQTTAEYQQRFSSPLSEELSDAPHGLLTPETRRKLF